MIGKALSQTSKNFLKVIIDLDLEYAFKSCLIRIYDITQNTRYETRVEYRVSICFWLVQSLYLESMVASETGRR